jgi:6-phosphogluconolactonase/glucosamine-6-phosphate isomerase/deaminase
MPVHLVSEPCSESDKGDKIYESKIDQVLLNSTIDFTILGVGYDGHIASLFPNQTSLDQCDKSVIYSDAGPDRVSPKRMTLTYPILNRSRHIAILVLGTKKHALLEKLSKQDESVAKDYPVLGLKAAEQNQLVWYIDEDAFSGDL